MGLPKPVKYLGEEEERGERRRRGSKSVKHRKPKQKKRQKEYKYREAGRCVEEEIFRRERKLQTKPNPTNRRHRQTENKDSMYRLRREENTSV